MRERDLLKPEALQPAAQRQLMNRVDNTVQQRHRHTAHPLAPRRLQLLGQGLIQLQRFAFGTIRRQAALHLQHLLLQRLGSLDRQGEQLRPVLIADPQQIGEAPVQQQQRGRTAALEKGIGGHRGAQPHLLHQASGDRGGIPSEAEHLPQGVHRRIPRAIRLLREHLRHLHGSGRGAGHHIGEGAAAINPEAPAGGSHSQR